MLVAHCRGRLTPTLNWGMYTWTLKQILFGKESHRASCLAEWLPGRRSGKRPWSPESCHWSWDVWELQEHWGPAQVSLVNRHPEHGTKRWAPRLNAETLRKTVSPARGMGMCVPLVCEIQGVMQQTHNVTVGQRFQQRSPERGMEGRWLYLWWPSWKGQV